MDPQCNICDLAGFPRFAEEGGQFLHLDLKQGNHRHEVDQGVTLINQCTPKPEFF